MDWMLATQAMSNYIIARTLVNDRTERSLKGEVTLSMIEDVNDKAITQAITWGAPIILKHLAQNQLRGKIGIAGRIAGRAGLRFVPFIGTALLVKDMYDLYQFFDDD